MKSRWWIVGTIATVLSVSTTYVVFEGPAGREAAWYPDQFTIVALESAAEKVSWVGQSSGTRQYPISEYARFYLGTMFEEHRLIEGEFVTAYPPYYEKGVHVVHNENEIPTIFDGGCGVVRVTFDADAKLIKSIKCNGLG